MLSDIEIAQKAKVKDIREIAESIGIREADLEYYGRYIAKIPLDVIRKQEKKDKGKLVLVTAITPTPAGEGKTVTTISLIQGLGALGKNVVGALREPSMGPTFGVKGGATGGGNAQVYPMWKIDLAFTGDIHAVASAHNLLSAMTENQLVRDNPLGIDPSSILLKKTLDMNCRELRRIIVGVGDGKLSGGVVHESGFIITSASEISAILALAEDYDDLRRRLSSIVVAYTYEGKPVTAEQIGAVGPMMAILVDALKPNLVQTLEGQPVFIHGFPFANIAHGNNSVIATRAAMAYGDYAVTEAGFAADLGGEKFMDIVCRKSGIRPDLVVIVATIKALMHHGGADVKDPSTFTAAALKKGFANLDKHIANMKSYGVPVMVSLNRFASDSDKDIKTLMDHCRKMGVECAFNDGFMNGGKGAKDLAEKVVSILDGRKKPRLKMAYTDNAPLRSKIEAVAKKIYGADGVVYSPLAEKQMAALTDNGYGDLPICIAKTQYSLSDDPALGNAPTGWTLHVREVNLSAGAGFIVPVCGQMMLMPGLGKQPAALRIDVDSEGNITGLK